jgi:hypothetical protein
MKVSPQRWHLFPAKAAGKSGHHLFASEHTADNRSVRRWNALFSLLGSALKLLLIVHLQEIRSTTRLIYTVLLRMTIIFNQNNHC